MSACLSEQRDMVRFLTREHDILEEVCIYDHLRPETGVSVIYVIEGIFYKRSHFEKIKKCAAECQFTTLIAESRPPKLKDARANETRMNEFLDKCEFKAKADWKPHLKYLLDKHEKINVEEDIALDV